ncbi:four-carbon acid sugar kinase family protein [Kocuria sp. M1R5S2]|uniref:four-carbon acid sugar kinase family protein n=1 Tax=Kocuria rhizosphaerae TaxID=3376285 RepID=UPI0037ACB91E
MRVLALADDLSGANEVAAALAALPGAGDVDAHSVQSAQFVPVAVHLVPTARPHDDEVVTVVNTDTRRDAAQEAAERLHGILAAASPGRTIFLKFDSLMRGHLGVQLREARRTAPVLFCPAVPELGRTVRDGVLHVGGRPLHESDLWAVEPCPPAHSIAAQLAPVPVRHLDLDTVRGDELGEVAVREAADGAVLVCDAEAPADLERIAAAGLAGGFVLAGAAGLAAALGRCLHPELGPGGAGAAGDVAPPHPRRTGVLVALGTASAAARRQVQRLESAGVTVHRLRPEQIAGFSLEHEGTVAVTVDADPDPALSAAVTAGLTTLVRRHHADRHLVLSGGETAQAVLGALGITRLVPLRQAHPGAVVTATDDGRLVTTRPGSYGGPDSLLEILTTMQTLQDTTGKVPS